MLVVFRQIVPGQLLGHSDLVAHSKKTHPSASIGIALLKLNLRQKIIVKLSIDFSPGNTVQCLNYLGE